MDSLCSVLRMKRGYTPVLSMLLWANHHLSISSYVLSIIPSSSMFCPSTISVCCPLFQTLSLHLSCLLHFSSSPCKSPFLHASMSTEHLHLFLSLQLFALHFLLFFTHSLLSFHTINIKFDDFMRCLCREIKTCIFILYLYLFIHSKGGSEGSTLHLGAPEHSISFVKIRSAQSHSKKT